MRAIIYILILLYSTPIIANESINIKEFDLNKETVCLIQTIYFEARGEDFIGQLGVATVVMERVDNKKFPNTICKVVKHGRYWKGNPVRNKCSFSYWCDGKSEKMYDHESFEAAIEISYLIMQGVRLGTVKGATHYHAYYVKPRWSYKMNHMFTTGKHLFYKEKK